MAELIDLGHGAGGLKMHELIERTFGPRFAGSAVEHMDDSAVLEEKGLRLAFTTDGFVVKPLFFPGGDLGRLAVSGTVNDLLMVGATPRWLSVAMIIEEGLELSVLEALSQSIALAANEAAAEVVTGDTKVVERGGADRVYITTSGVGIVSPGIKISGSRARPGMDVIISGTLGDHEAAVLNAREKIVESEDLLSDCSPLVNLVQKMLEACPQIACMRDPSRGGLATTLNEIARQSKIGIEIDEKNMPVRPAVSGFCDLLGLDPLYLANEGKLIAIVDKGHSECLLESMRSVPEGAGSRVVGRAVENHPGTVVLKTALGGRRALDMLSGRPIPRIC